MAERIKRWKILAALLAGVTGLFAVAYLTLHLPEDPVARYHDDTPFRAFFNETRNTWPLKAQVVRDRFGAPNRYGSHGHFPWDLTTRANSTWVYRLESGGTVLLHVIDGDVVHAMLPHPGIARSVEFLRPAPREPAVVAP